MGQKLGYEGCLILVIFWNFLSHKICLIFQLRYGRIFQGGAVRCIKELIFWDFSAVTLFGHFEREIQISKFETILYTC